MVPSGSKPIRRLGPEYELGLFMFVLTTSPESLAFDIGKQVDVADKFDDVVIRVDNEYTSLQAKLENNPEENFLDPDVLIGRKSLHKGGFSLLKYFVSYLRIKDQFESSGDKILKKLVIFSNTRLGKTTVSENDIILENIAETTDIVIAKTHSTAQRYKIKETSNDLKQYLRKYLKSDSEILSAELAKYFSPFQFVYDKKSIFSLGILKYYYPDLIYEEIIEKDGVEAKFTKNFIENHGNLSDFAKTLRDALTEFMLENSFGKVDEELLKDKLNNLRLTVSDGKQIKNYAAPSCSNPRSPILLQALANHIIPTDKCMSLNTDAFRYYHTALIKENVITVHKSKKEGIISDAFIENVDLSKSVKKLRDLIPSTMESHAQKLETYFEEAKYLQKSVNSNVEEYLRKIRSLKSAASSADPQNLKTILKNVNLSISNNFGETKSENAIMYLPNYDITEESIDDFLCLLEFRLNELGVRDLLQEIKNEKIKDRFLMYFDLDPEYLNREIRDIVEEWKKSGGSTAAEGWILNSQRKEFIQYLETKISRPIANHKTRECVQDLKQKKEKFDIRFKNYAPFEASYFQTENKIFYIKTDCVLLSAIKMLNYLIEEKNADYIFINVESLAKKEEIMKLANSFHDDKFKSLVLSYELSLGSELEQQLFDALSEILKNHSKKIFIITSVSEDERYKDQLQTVLDKDISLADLENPSKILEHKVLFQGEPTALKILIDADDVSALKLVNAKTFDEIFKNKPIRIGCRPFALSDLPGAYAHLSEEVNKETFLNNLICNSSENIFLISGIQFQDKERAENNLIENLELSQENEKSTCDIIFQKINVLKRPYSTQPANKVIQLVDPEFDDSNFKEFCGTHPGKMVFWVKWDETKFELQQIYNPDFYLSRKFVKYIIQNSLLKTFERTEDQFVFSSVSDRKAFAQQLFKREYSELERMEVFVTHDTETARNKFNDLSHTVHWLGAETNFGGGFTVWRDSKGSVKNLRNFISEAHALYSGQESELLLILQDKQAVIIADDPGMGKSTTLVKLYGSEGGQNGLLSSHWVININLRDHLQAIRAISDSMNGIKEFLSKVSPDLDDNLSQSLLGFTLCAENNPKKPLLITLDGFDEVLDEDDRMKVISLLAALKEKTCVKVWITTRLHHQNLLENALCTLSVKFQPLDEDEQRSFIRNFFRDRLRLLLSESKFHEIFDDVFDETSKMYKYCNFFLEKMKSVFVKNLQRFIGTPLQLDLLLGSKGSVKEFQNWAESSPDSVPNFDYLGQNVLEVYEKFIAGKYETYSKRVGIKEGVKQNYYFKHWIYDCKYLAKSIFFPGSENSLFEDKAVVLAPGLIKSNGNNLEFIHPTFGEYFVSEVFVRWIEKNVDRSNTQKQKMLVKNVLMNESYQVIRSFLNARLSNKLQALPEKRLREYERIIGEELENEPCKFNTSSYITPLHIAARECNANIAAFLCSSVKHDTGLLKKFIRAHDNMGMKNVLHIASEKGCEYIIKILFKLFADDVVFLKELLKTSCGICHLLVIHKHGWTSLHVAAQLGHVKIIETLLEPFSSDVGFLKELLSISEETKRDLPAPYTGRRFGWTVFHVAAHYGFDKVVEKLLQPFSSNEELLKSLLKISSDVPLYDPSFLPFIRDSGWTVLHRAAVNGHLSVIEKLLAPFANDTESLEELLKIPTEYRKSTVLHFLASHEDSGETIKILLGPFTDDKREILIGIQAKPGNTALHNAAALGHDKVIQQLLSYFDKSSKEKLLKIRTESGKTVFHLAVQSGHSNTVERVFESFADKLKWLKMEDNMKNSSLHIAALEGHPNIIDMLLDCAKNVDAGWETFKNLIEMRNNDGMTAFEVATNTGEINEIVKKFIDQANNENAPNEIVSLLSKIHVNLSSNPKKKTPPTIFPSNLYLPLSLPHNDFWNSEQNRD